MLAICHKPKIKIAGFGLIEMLVAIAIIGILSSIAANNFGTWVQNTKTRAVAESLENGLRLAQSEAIKRGRQTVFRLSTTAAFLNSNNWIVQVLVRGATDTASVDNSVGTNGVIYKGSFADADSVVIAGQSKLRFNSIGRLVAEPATRVYRITNDKGTEQWQVSVSLSGTIKIIGPLAVFAIAPR